MCSVVAGQNPAGFFNSFKFKLSLNVSSVGVNAVFFYLLKFINFTVPGPGLKGLEHLPAEESWGSRGCPAAYAAIRANNANFNAQEPLALFIALQIMQELLFFDKHRMLMLTKYPVFRLFC